MSKRRFLRGSDDAIDLNISPLIDMVFILLIFFIVTTVFVEEEGIDVNKPTPGAPSQSSEENKIIILEITQHGKILHEGVELGLNSVRSTVSKLNRREKLPVIIEANPKAPSGIMVRVMDEARQGGAETISISTKSS